MSDEDRRVRLAGDVLTHDVAWMDNVSGYTRCGLDFKWRPDEIRSNARLMATVTEQECDCMTCFVNVNRGVNFVTSRGGSVLVFNIAAISNLNFDID